MAAPILALDTETTGLSARRGDRIVEIACVPVEPDLFRSEPFYALLNPERAIPAAVSRIHGIRDEDVAGKPRFADVAAAFVDYVSGCRLVIHNACFDAGFLDMELARCGLGPLSSLCTVSDTLRLSRALHPGEPASLDALCRRYGISLASRRERHGALIDAELLVQVYLRLADEAAKRRASSASAQRYAPPW